MPKVFLKCVYDILHLHVDKFSKEYEGKCYMGADAQTNCIIIIYWSNKLSQNRSSLDQHWL